MLSVMRRTHLALACAAALVAACSKSDKAADSARATDSAAAAASANTAAAPATPAAPAMTDAVILAFFDEANAADSTSGSIAAARGTNAEVKSFGRDMMRDHHALRVAGQDVAKKTNVTPQPAPNDTTAAHASKMADSLKAQARGAAWDKAYIASEIAAHEAVLNTAQTAFGATQNPDIKALIQKATPNVQAHLDHAKQIQSKLQ